MQVARTVVDVGAGGSRDLLGIDAVADRKVQAVLFNQRRRVRLVVDGQGDDLESELIELRFGAGKCCKLRVALRAPRAAIDECRAIGAGQILPDRQSAVCDRIKGHDRKGIAIVEMGHFNSS